MAFKFNAFTHKLDITGTSGGGGGGVSSLTGNSGGAISPDGGGNINVIGGGSVTVTGTPINNTLTITVPTVFFNWTLIVANQMAVKNEGYFVNGGANVELTLPAASAVGDTFRVVDKGGNGFSIIQGAGQYIKINTSTTTVGAAGSLSSILQGEAIELVCAVANTEWWVVDSMGNLTVV